MPILIDELELEVLPTGVPDGEPEARADSLPLQTPEHEVLALLDLIDERRARLAVD